MFLGLVGKPSAGKSTLFKALTLMDVAIANYPFTTIKPNEGVAFARVQCVDKELGTQCNPRVGYCVEHTRFVPVKVLDVAGLVPGAHEGKGLGLEFLNDLSQADCLIHVIDISGSLNEHGEPVERGSHDPAQDVLFLERELDEWYFSIFQKVWKRFAFAVKQTHEDAVKAVARQFSGLRVTEDLVKEKLAALGLAEKPLVDWSETELRTLTSALRRATKPILVAATSNAGAFGVLASGNMPPEALAKDIRETRKRTDRPFGVNLITIAPNFEPNLDVAIKEGAEFVIFAGAIPPQPAIASGPTIQMTSDRASRPMMASTMPLKRKDSSFFMVVSLGLRCCWCSRGRQTGSLQRGG